MSLDFVVFKAPDSGISASVVVYMQTAMDGRSSATILPQDCEGTPGRIWGPQCSEVVSPSSP